MTPRARAFYCWAGALLLLVAVVVGALSPSVTAPIAYPALGWDAGGRPVTGAPDEIHCGAPWIDGYQEFPSFARVNGHTYEMGPEEERTYQGTQHASCDQARAAAAEAPGAMLTAGVFCLLFAALPTPWWARKRRSGAPRLSAK